MRHLVNRQRLLAPPVTGEDAPHPIFGMPQVEQGQPVLAE
jgi:hypothetical protein